MLVVFPGRRWPMPPPATCVSMTISNRLCLAARRHLRRLRRLARACRWQQIGLHLAAGALVLVVCFGLFAAGWIGGGDAKLAAATALWFGFEQLLPYLAVAGVVGGVLTLAILMLRVRAAAGVRPRAGLGCGGCIPPTRACPTGSRWRSPRCSILPDTALWRAAIGV